MRWVSRLTTAAIVAIVATALVVAIVSVAKPATVTGNFETSALFRDASGLPVGSRVVIAGVTVGRIDRLTIEGNLARVHMRLIDDVVILDDAFATKKASSALGDNYVEISPGGPDPADPGDTRPRRRLRSGEPIPLVVEATTTDRVLRSVERALPRLDDNLAAANAFLDEGREWVSGDFAQRIAALERRLDDGAIARPLREVHDATVRFDERTTELAGNVADGAPVVARRLRELPGQIAAVTGDLRDARAQVTGSLGDARAKIDEADRYIDQAGELIDELAGAPGAKQGRLARMINDPSAGESLAATAADVESVTGALDRVKTTLGFRTEFNLLAVQPRFYVTAELAARNDTFYLIEAEKGPTGDNPAVTLVAIPDSGEFQRSSLISEKLRFTAQWGRRFGRSVSVRLGIKESQFGAGVDVALVGGHLKLTLDAMESNFSEAPRIKVAAALRVFRELYVLGGVDDVLTDGAELRIAPWGVAEPVPNQFETLRYGRDYYLGFELRFHDQDINRILMIYGALIAGLLI
ncbi:MAG TPA: MlaD family protein [Kofleriaceae bacterium]|nr:MlaD family protein [Kofleriaceae bacterium]